MHIVFIRLQRTNVKETDSERESGQKTSIANRIKLNEQKYENTNGCKVAHFDIK